MDGIIQMLPAPLRCFSTHMDYPGQRLAEKVFQVIMLISGIIGFCAGYATQQLSVAVYVVLAGTAVASLAVLPPWPCFRQNPIPWEKVKESDAKNGAADEAKGKKKETKKMK